MLCFYCVTGFVYCSLYNTQFRITLQLTHERLMSHIAFAVQICLQFPDALLHESVQVALCLGKRLGSIPYILADTSYGR
jgi:diphthamide biosynthesis enzyme Dph1/Dph2-like protein